MRISSYAWKRVREYEYIYKNIFKTSQEFWNLWKLNCNIIPIILSFGEWCLGIRKWNEGRVLPQQVTNRLLCPHYSCVHLWGQIHHMAFIGWDALGFFLSNLCYLRENMPFKRIYSISIICKPGWGHSGGRICLPDSIESSASSNFVLVSPFNMGHSMIARRRKVKS